MSLNHCIICIIRWIMSKGLTRTFLIRKILKQRVRIDSTQNLINLYVYILYQQLIALMDKVNIIWSNINLMNHYLVNYIPFVYSEENLIFPGMVHTSMFGKLLRPWYQQHNCNVGILIELIWDANMYPLNNLCNVQWNSTLPYHITFIL